MKMTEVLVDLLVYYQQVLRESFLVMHLVVCPHDGTLIG